MGKHRRRSVRVSNFSSANFFHLPSTHSSCSRIFRIAQRPPAIGRDHLRLCRSINTSTRSFLRVSRPIPSARPLIIAYRVTSRGYYRNRIFSPLSLLRAFSRERLRSNRVDGDSNFPGSRPRTLFSLVQVQPRAVSSCPRTNRKYRSKRLEGRRE